MYALPSPSLDVRDSRWTLPGCSSDFRMTISPVPSGEPSSTTSMSASMDCCSTASMIAAIFSHSLYVGMMTRQSDTRVFYEVQSYKITEILLASPGKTRGIIFTHHSVNGLIHVFCIGLAEVI